MKRLKLLTFLTVLYPCIAFGAPFLVCDPDPNATHYLVTLDGGAEVEVTAPLHFDLKGVATGKHSLSVKAKNKLWGVVSDATPLDFVRPLLSKPGLRLSEE